MTRIAPLIAFTALALTACDLESAPVEPTANPIPSTAPEPPAEARVVSRILLSQSTPVGITIAPDTGERYVLDAWEGLFKLEGGSATLFVGSAALVPDDGIDRRPYTDVVAIGMGQFAYTVQSDGILYDHNDGIARQHFCYEPEDSGLWGIDSFQLTQALGFDGANRRLVAQPQTFPGPADASVGAWNADLGGQPTDWSWLPWPEFDAGGLVVDQPGQVLLGHDSLLYRMTLGQDGEPAPVIDLARFGVQRVEGLAIDPASGNLVVLDADHEVVEIADWKQAEDDTL